MRLTAPHQRVVCSARANLIPPDQVRRRVPRFNASLLDVRTVPKPTQQWGAELDCGAALAVVLVQATFGSSGRSPSVRLSGRQ
jgi:hypothetical protein